MSVWYLWYHGAFHNLILSKMVKICRDTTQELVDCLCVTCQGSKVKCKVHAVSKSSQIENTPQ